MRQTLYILFLFLALALSADAQKLTVESFKASPSDISALSYSRDDLNGKKCAIVKVQFVGDILRVEGNTIGEPLKRDTETWVYMTQRSRQMQIVTKDYLPVMVNFEDYGVPALESGTTYILTLVKPNAAGNQPVDAGGNFLALSVNPTNAMVYLDNSPLPVASDGQYMQMLPYGNHTYRVEAGGYVSKSGTFEIASGEAKTLTVSLVSAMAKVTIKCPTSGVAIYVDKKQVGTGTWTGELSAGMHLVEAKKTGYRDTQKTLQLSEQQKLDVTLDALTAIQGGLSVVYKPIGSDIYVDGTKVGQTPKIINDLLVGTHKVDIRKDGYASQSKTVTITEGQTTTLEGSLTANASPQVASISSNGAGTNTQTFTVNGVTFDMIRVQGGTFTMGATVEQGSDADDDEKPSHRVTLNNYYIGKTEVTQALWQAVMGSKPTFNGGWTAEYGVGNNYPAYRVSWDDCQEFIKKLNQLSGKTFRLPTEAEWEYACRGGNKSKGYEYSGSNNIEAVAWYDSNSSSKTHPVATKSPNELGIYDMSGNVWEWCSDWNGSYSNSSQTNPTGPTSGSDRVNRGGSWSDLARLCRSSNRYYDAPGNRYSFLGLRLVFSQF